MIKFWGVEEVGNWLESLGLAEYKEQFAKHDVRGPELLNLERSDLKVGQVTRWNEMANIGGGSRGSRGGGSWTFTCKVRTDACSYPCNHDFVISCRAYMV